MATFLDLNSWNRKAQFAFFRTYEQPFFNICAPVDVTRLLAFVKERRGSFFRTSLFLSTKATNAIESFRYRIRESGVVVHDKVHPGSTILNDDETFGFCYFDFREPFSEFDRHVEEVLRRYRSREGELDPRDDRDDLIHYSIIPWIAFTSFKHARKTGREDSIPKIVFGKYFASGEYMRMPVSVEVHHALMDGIHVGKYFHLLQSYFDEPERHLSD